jgi:serine/threonine-protein kinase
MSAPRYREESLLGTGGMAEVWRAEGPFGPVALKRLLPHAARDPSVTAAFEREGRLLSRIRHPNVVGIHEITRDERGACLVLEYVQGADLRALSNGPVPLAIALRITRDLLLALDAVHGLCDEEGNPLGLIHRDLSPANVLIGLDGQVKLTDFGISRAQWGSNATTGQSIKGTLAYLSPEQAMKAPVDGRSDLFSTGALLYEMLAAAPIYDEDDPRLALARARAGEVRSIGEKCPDLPAAIVELVDRALAASPADRFPNAAAMRVELERAAERAGGLASDEELARWSAGGVGAGARAPRGAPAGTTMVSRPARSGKAMLGFAAVAMLAIVGVVAVAVSRRATAPAAGRAAIEVSVANEGTVAAQAPAPALPAHAAALPTHAAAMPTLPAAAPVPQAVASADEGSERRTAPAWPAARAATGRAEAPRGVGDGEPGLLDIGSDPAFAYVTIDGAKAGATPLFGRPVAPGTHRIEVSRDGLGSKSFTIEVAPGARIHKVVKLP